MLKQIKAELGMKNAMLIIIALVASVERKSPMNCVKNWMPIKTSPAVINQRERLSTGLLATRFGSNITSANAICVAITTTAI